MVINHWAIFESSIILISLLSEIITLSKVLSADFASIGTYSFFSLNFRIIASETTKRTGTIAYNIVIFCFLLFFMVS